MVWVRRSHLHHVGEETASFHVWLFPSLFVRRVSFHHRSLQTWFWWMRFPVWFRFVSCMGSVRGSTFLFSLSTLYAVALSVRGWLRLVGLVSTRSCLHSFHVYFYFSFRGSCTTHPSRILLSIDEVSMDESFCGLFTCGGQVEIGVSLFFSFEVSFDHGFGPRGGGPVAFLSHHLHLFRLPSHRHFLSQVRGTCERGDGCHGGALAHPPTLPRLHSPALTHPSPTSQPTSQPKRPSPPLPSSPERGERSTGTGTDGSTWPVLCFCFLFLRSRTRGGKKRFAPGAVGMAIVKVEGIHRLLRVGVGSTPSHVVYQRNLKKRADCTSRPSCPRSDASMERPTPIRLPSTWWLSC